MAGELPAAVVIDRSYRLRYHDEYGNQLWAWDTGSERFDGLCGEKGVTEVIPFFTASAPPVNGDRHCVCAIHGPPATVYTLAVTNFQPSTAAGAGAAPDLRFLLLAGTGRATFRAIEGVWTPPNGFGNSDKQAWIWQFSGVLCSSWWLFCQTDGVNAATQAQVSVRMLLSRGPAIPAIPTIAGPNVVLIP